MGNKWGGGWDGVITGSFPDAAEMEIGAASGWRCCAGCGGREAARPNSEAAAAATLLLFCECDDPPVLLAFAEG